MIKEERFKRILRKLNYKTSVTYATLAQDLKVSEDTIRRDIELLHHNGLLSKVRGGAIRRSQNPLTFQDRSQYLKGGKDIIALKTRQFVCARQTIFMDGGTTICAVATQLPADIPLRIITNNQALVPVLAPFSLIEVVLIGGTYERNTECALGSKTVDEVRMYVADLYIMGICAIDRNYGITAALRSDGEVKQAMRGASLSTIAVVNGEKLNSTGHFKVCDFTEINTLVTDLPSGHELLNSYRNAGVMIV